MYNRVYPVPTGVYMWSVCLYSTAHRIDIVCSSSGILYLVPDICNVCCPKLKRGRTPCMHYPVLGGNNVGNSTVKERERIPCILYLGFCISYVCLYLTVDESGRTPCFLSPGLAIGSSCLDPTVDVRDTKPCIRYLRPCYK